MLTTVPYSKDVSGQKQVKKAKIAWIVSNCHSFNHREVIAENLAKFVQVDIFGHCGKPFCQGMITIVLGSIHTWAADFFADDRFIAVA
jgi:hypothetical protein